MKIQDVKKECLAITGLSVEFSNSEVSSLSSLLWDVTLAVDMSIENAHQTGVPATIDLKSLKRVQWLLFQLTRHDTSGLFDNADSDYRADCTYINNISAVKM